MGGNCRGRSGETQEKEGRKEERKDRSNRRHGRGINSPPTAAGKSNDTSSVDTLAEVRFWLCPSCGQATNAAPQSS